jgi:hypothetical protein
LFIRPSWVEELMGCRVMRVRMTKRKGMRRVVRRMMMRIHWIRIWVWMRMRRVGGVGVKRRRRRRMMMSRLRVTRIAVFVLYVI